MDTKMSDWEEFLDLDNFRLAWQRVRRSNHYYNKDWTGLRVYAAKLEDNLESLMGRLRAGTYKPSLSERLYVPKPSGALRSFPFLCIDDRIVYQAIVNIVGHKSKASFEAIVRGHVFAHLLSTVSNVYMIRRWDGPKGQRRRFLNRFKALWLKGNKWVFEADIASYYDSIDHDLLCQRLQSEYACSDDLINLLRECLQAWTPHEDGPEFSRGVPQGYKASDYLATLFLLPVDKYFIQRSGNSHYIRYVDDFRILAPDQETAEQSLAELDIALKKQALILQGAKTAIREIVDIDTEIDRLSKKMSMMEALRVEGVNVGREAIFMFRRAWRELKEQKTGERDKHVESHLVFAMNRMPVNKTAKGIAIEMLPRMYWRSRDITNYLGKFKEDEDVIQVLLGELRNHNVYSWHLANCLRALSRISGPNRCRDICHSWISNEQLPWYQKLAAIQSLQDDPESYSFLLLRYEQKRDNYLLRRAMLVAAILTASMDDQRATVIRAGMRDENRHVAATAARLFWEFSDCGVGEDEFDETRLTHRDICYIGYVLTERFHVTIPNNVDLKMAFGSAYIKAVSCLRCAMIHYDTDPDLFITHLNNFNQVIIIRMNELFTINSNISEDQYDQMLKSSEFRKDYGAMATHFLKCYELRKVSTVPHAWSKDLGTWSRIITFLEKDRLVQDISAAYRELVDVFTDKFGI